MYNKKICKPTTYAEVFRGKINVIFFNVKHLEFYFTLFFYIVMVFAIHWHESASNIL